jgi:hypothetical protein
MSVKESQDRYNASEKGKARNIKCREQRLVTSKKYRESEKGKAKRKAWYDKRGGPKGYYYSRQKETLVNASRYAARGRAFLASLKNRPCADCGGRFPPECMDFDHVRGDKTIGLAQMITYTRAAIEAEAEKCDIICSNCHRIRTRKRKLGDRYDYLQ